MIFSCCSPLLPPVKFLAKISCFFPLLALLWHGQARCRWSAATGRLPWSIERAAQGGAGGQFHGYLSQGHPQHRRRNAPLRKGGFVLAIKSGHPMVPVTVGGTGSFSPGLGPLHPGTIKVVLGRPVPTDTSKSKVKMNLWPSPGGHLADYDPSFLRKGFLICGLGISQRGFGSIRD